MTAPTHAKYRRPFALALLATCAGAATAAPSATKPMLAAYTDSIGGQHLVSGQVTTALEQLEAAPASVPASANRCVAYIVEHRFDVAESACNEAITRAQGEPIAPSPFGLEEHQQQVALALSNRAVLHWLEAQPQGAVHDLARARSESPDADYVRHNLRVFGRAAVLAEHD